MRFVVGALVFLASFLPQAALPFTADEINVLLPRVKESPVGDRVAFWAEQFIGTPYDTDPLGDYVRRYVPELASLPPKTIHRPWTLGAEALARLGYPAPLVDHAEASAAFVGSRAGSRASA